MVRVSHPKPGNQATPSNGLRGAKISKQRNRHKVVFEDVEQKKQKSLYFRSDPPTGYTFIPAGNPQLTEALKEFAKKSNREIFAVTATPHASRHELSREVHRIGWHFPTEVVAQVCSYYGIRLTASGKLVEDKDDDKLFMKVYQRGQLVLDEKVRDQVTINTEAKQIIKDLFPNIPDNDLFKIIKTAFQVGDGKVGTADEIPLVRRAQLSVVAHIRHTYTNYDKLLRQVAYSEARHSVESETLKKLIEWRGDDDDKEAVEDTLREVVVISDEEDSDDEIEDGQILNHEDVRVQLIPSTARQDHNSGVRPLTPVEHYSGNNPAGTSRYVPQVVHRAPIRSQAELMASQQRSRYAVWDRYRQEYRAAAAPQPARVVERILIEEPPNPPSSFPVTPRNPVREAHTVSDQPRQIQALDHPGSPTYIRGTDGRLYERLVLPADVNEGNVPYKRGYSPPTSTGTNAQYVKSRPASPRPYSVRVPLHRRTISLEDNDGTVVQSIEGSNDTYQSLDARRNLYDTPTDISQKRHSGGYHTRVPQHIPADAMSRFDGSKRQRVDVTPPSPFLQHQQRTIHASERTGVAQPSPHARIRSEQYSFPQTYKSDGMADGSSPRYPRQQVIYDQPLSSASSHVMVNGASSYLTNDVSRTHGRTAYLIQDDQMGPRYVRPVQDGRVREHAQPAVETLVADHRRPSAVQRVSGSGNQIRYVQVDDQRNQQPNAFYSEIAPARHTQQDEYIPTNMARRSSGHNRDYRVISQSSQHYREEPPIRTTYIRQ